MLTKIMLFKITKIKYTSLALILSCAGFLLSTLVYAQEQQLGEINLGATVQGNKELPKILYIIPWATPPGPGQVDPLIPHSANVFERTFAPIERLEQQRRLHYYAEGDNTPAQ